MDSAKVVVDFYDFEEGAWKYSLFQHRLPPHVFAEIMALPPLAPDIGPDRVIWSLTNNGI